MGKYNTSSDVLILTIEDCTGRKILKSRTNCTDVKEIAKAIQQAVDKEGLPIYIRYLSQKDYVEVKDEKFEW